MAEQISQREFLHIPVERIIPDPAHARRRLDAEELKGLVNSLQRLGVIHPLLVQPADANGQYRLIVGERRWRAAREAGLATVPALVHSCSAEEALELQVFENMGQGVRQPLEPRDMARAIARIARRYEDQEAAAGHFGRKGAWLQQATAAARLSPEVDALLETGRLGSTSTALQLEKLARKDEGQARELIERIAQLPEGEKLPRQEVEQVLVRAGVKRARKPPQAEADAESAAPARPAAPAPTPADSPAAAPGASEPPPWESATPEPAVVRRRVNPGKVRQVAQLLGVSDGDEEEVLARLIDEFLALKGEA